MSSWLWYAVASGGWVLVFGWRLVVAVRLWRRVRWARSELVEFRRRAVPATGEVVDNQIESVPGRAELAPAMVVSGSHVDLGVASVPGPAGLRFHPIIEFTTGEGQRVRFAAETSSHRSWVPGQTIAVRYDPLNPHDAEVPGERPMPRPVGPALRVAAHAGWVLAGAVYLVMMVVAIVVLGEPQESPPSGPERVLWVMAVISVCAAGVGVVLRLVAAVLTPRWHKRL